MEMKEYKVVVKNSKEAEDVRNLFELLGYKKESFHFNCYYPRSVVTEYRYEFGAWRTESEIKQVVAALRSVFKCQ